MKNIRARLAGILGILAASYLLGFLACGSAASSNSTTTPATTTTTAATPESLLVGEWKGTNSTNNCVASTAACYNTIFTVTFTSSGTYSIVTDDGGADAGTFAATTSTITTVTATIKTSPCFTVDFLANVAYTLSTDGKTLTIPVCPLTFTKQ